MRSVRFAACAATLVLAPAALAACGSSDDSSSQDDADITASITKVATVDDPSTCTEFQSENFVKETSGTLEDCKKDPSAEADSVKVSNIEVDGDNATADVAFTGGFVDSQTLNIALVKDGDTWKLDSLKSFTDFDRDAFTKQLLTPQPGEKPTQQQLDCLQKQVDQASDQELENVLLEPNGGDQIFGPCFQGGGGD